MVKIDPRGKNDILLAMKERAKSFTPEWNFDINEPDIAAALAVTCAEMFEGTIKKINGLPLKNQIAFYNMLNASLLPGIPSEGYVSFALSSEEAGSEEVPAGTVVSSYGGDGEPVHFETLDDLLVCPATIVKSFCVDDTMDHIGAYENITSSSTELFRLPEKNLQSHILSVGHPYAFHICSSGEIKVSFFHHGGVPLRSDDIRMLTEKHAATVEYYSGDNGYIPFEEIREQDGGLILCKGEGQPPVKTDEDGFQLRVNVSDISAFRNYRFVYAEASPSGRQILADCITDGNTELDRNAFFVFGEHFQLFNEIYFGCDEVLDKRGAYITMNFDLSFLKVPLENQLPDDEIRWKWIAKKSDFKERASYLLSITEVIWEYYNGYGWSRLFPDRSYYDVFNFEDGATNCYRSITFLCPEDISPIFVGAKEDHYIRARVLKAENLYKLKGFYMSPFIRNLSFDYSYPDEGCRIYEMTARNNLEQQVYDPRHGGEFTPFYGTDAEHRMVYLGFSSPPENGPLRTLWDVSEDPLAKVAPLSWQYLSTSGWKPMNMVDETNSFTTIGLTIFLDNHDFASGRIFGEELYWVRITDINDKYRRGEAGFPMTKSISFNAVRARNVDSHKEEYFAMNVYTDSASFDLSSGGILEIEVYVNEYLTITEAETEALQAQGRISKIHDEAGMEKELWVRWNEVDTFVDEDANSRCFIADRSSGKITFGNGRKGRIPSASDTNNIRVIYTTGGGVRSNAGAGEISGMERSIGLVSSVSNPKRFYGGCDTETVYKALERNAVMLRTQGKVITINDLEELALCGSRSIEKVKAFAGRNMLGESERGVVTLVVLRSESAEFSRIRNDLREYLLPRISGNIASSDSLYITEPTFIRMNIKAEIAADTLGGIFELKRSIDRCISDCINSYRGKPGSRDWILGRLPNVHQLRSAILRLEHITYIKRISVTTYVSGAGGMTEIDEDRIRLLPYVLPECGENDISIVQTSE